MHYIFFIAALLSATPTAAADLSPMDFLVGHCWTGVFPDGKNRDRHCFESVYGGKFIRDRHVVTPADPAVKVDNPYGGETIYGWDPEKKAIAYTYFNSLGGISTGTVQVEGSDLVFPERHVAKDGSVKQMRNVWRRIGADQYTTTLGEVSGDGTRELRRMTFTRDTVNLPPEKSKECTSPAHRQFDFWIGKWRVETPDGKVAGINEISSTLGGCVLHEKWTGASGMRGQSFNIYDPVRGLWHQTWVDSNGTLLQLEGKIVDGKMILSGKRQTEKGWIEDRITWSTIGPRVQQVWEQSDDAGRSWTNVFTGTYTRE